MASLNSCRRELRSIIAELESIERGIRRDFTGIGEDKCANCVGRVVSHYNSVLYMLNTVDTNLLADWFVKEK